MIRFSDKNTKPLVKSMWKTVFEDKDEYIDLIFSRKYKHENTLVYFEDNVAVAALQMFPYTIRFYGEVIPFYYLAGLCTLPEYRNRGFMGKLILESFRIMRDRNIPMSILVPAEEWLFGYYEKYGFADTFDRGAEPVAMKTILDNYTIDAGVAFGKFDRDYQQRDFCVLKDADDMKSIIDDYLMDGCPDKYNLAAMSRSIDSLFLLETYARKNTDLTFKIKVVDNVMNSTNVYQINHGTVLSFDKSDYDFEVNEKQFIQLLFGYKIEKKLSLFHKYFPSHNPVINLMLE